jgi:deoxyribonucleoside regulator
MKTSQPRLSESQEAAGKQKDRLQECSDVATLFYRHKETKTAIAKKLKRTPMQVVRLLNRAHETGVVEIKIHSRRLSEIHEQLQKTYGLRAVRTVPFLPAYKELRETLGKEAAIYFDELIGNRSATVGIDGGRATYHLIDSLKTSAREIKIYPLTCKWRDLRISYVDANILVHLLRYKSGETAEGFWIPLQPLLGGINSGLFEKQEQEYSADSQVKAVISAAAQVDVALISAGILRKESSTALYLKKKGFSFEELQSKYGVVGITCGTCYDKDANAITQPLLSVTLKQLGKLAKRKDKTVMLTAGGEHKLQAIKALLRKRMCNVLITDDKTAINLLKQ